MIRSTLASPEKLRGTSPTVAPMCHMANCATRDVCAVCDVVDGLVWPYLLADEFVLLGLHNSLFQSCYLSRPEQARLFASGHVTTA